MKTDHDLQRDVMDELLFEPRVDHSQIGVAAKDGVVTLTGTVPDYDQKLAAEEAARRVSGVKAIAQDIEVHFACDPETSDAEIARRILDLFLWNVTIPADAIGVKVEHGRVTLTGKVEWNYQKQAALKAVAQTGGVKGVTNLIEVESKKVSPAEVRERILAAFKRSSALDADAISVNVDGGTVKLSGSVQGWNERRVAEHAAWSVPGVTNVQDDIVMAY